MSGMANKPRRPWSQAGDLACLGLLLAGAYGLKLHYSQASAEDLRWVLGPTALLVELVTGME